MVVRLAQVLGCRDVSELILSETYALAQQYAAPITEPELYWAIVDRARMAAKTVFTT
ncbi:hypothetical protein [Streptomyces sp. NPDC048659]|uniref:hypothetical protein n=1 Tax=Streptomyces sp. NPDC048659 TaxID=3155489 RepID=UPI003438E62D